MSLDHRRFIAANTALIAPPHVPEIVLHLADEAHALWLKTEEELEQIGLPPPFWAFAWAGGQGLARYILDHPEIVAGRKVLDLACGSGLVAIAAAKAGAASVAAYDIDVFCAAAVDLNAAANGVAVEFIEGDVTRDETLAGRVPFDIILAGDIAYQKDMAEHLFGWLSVRQAEGAAVLIGDPGRAYLPKTGLMKLAEYQVPVTRDLEDAEVKRTIVWEVARNAQPA